MSTLEPELRDTDMDVAFRDGATTRRLRRSSAILPRGCWEVDILPANVIEAELDEQVRGWIDSNLWRRRAADIERARG
jgi:hypothetical protein